MITEENTVRYLRNLVDSKRGEKYSFMEKSAKEDYVPIIQKESSDTLVFLTRMIKPKRILELGCAIGYSAILMADCDKRIRIDTIEKNPDMIERASKNIEIMEMTDRINVLEGDISEVLDTLNGPYDLVFIDAAKSHYREYLEKCLKLISEDGTIICDNVLIDGKVALDETTDKKHARYINRMKEFVRETFIDERFDTTVLPVGDGLMIIRRKDNRNEK